MAERSVLGNNDIYGVRWLRSLTESELDLLMGLKNLVRVRAKKIGHEDLWKIFNLKMLRELSVIFMKDLKERVNDIRTTSGFDSNSLHEKTGSSFCNMNDEELYPYICADQRKRIADMFLQDMPPPTQKHKTAS